MEFCRRHQVDRQSWRVKEKIQGGRKRKGEETKNVTLLASPSRHWLMAQGLSFLLIGHPGVDSGKSSALKHAHVALSHKKEKKTPAIFHSPYRWSDTEEEPAATLSGRRSWRRPLKTSHWSSRNEHPSFRLELDLQSKKTQFDCIIALLFSLK